MGAHCTQVLHPGGGGALRCCRESLIPEVRWGKSQLGLEGAGASEPVVAGKGLKHGYSMTGSLVVQWCWEYVDLMMKIPSN